jgi:hypothetical protein
VPAVTYTISAKDNASKNVKNVERSFQDMQRGAYKATESILSVEKAQLALGGVAAGFVLLKDVAQVAGRALQEFAQATKFVIDSSVSLKTQSVAVQSSFVQLASALGDSIGQSEAMINVVDRLLLKMGEWQTDVVASEAQVQESVDFMLDVTQKLLIAGSYIYDTYNAAAAAIAGAYELALKAATPLRIALDEDMPWWSKAKGMYDFFGPGTIFTALRAWDAVGTEWDKASTRIKAGSKNADEFRASLRDLFSALKGAEETGPTINMAPFDFGANKGGASGKAGAASKAKDDTYSAEKMVAENERVRLEAAAFNQKMRDAEAADSAASMAASLAADHDQFEARLKAQVQYQQESERLRQEQNEAIHDEIERQAKELEKISEGMFQTGKDAYMGLAQGAAAAFTAVATGEASFEEAMKAQAQAVVLGVAEQATVKAAWEAAEAIGSFASGNVAAAVLHGKAALMYAGVASVGYAAGSAMDSAGWDGGWSGSGAGSTVGGSSYADQRVRSEQAASPLVYEIHQHFSGVYTSEAEAGRKIQDAIYTANRGGTSALRRATSRAY